MPNNQYADTATIVSITGALISVGDFQPIVTMIASLVAITSGLLAIRYYYKATEKLNK
jgi:hypothetical protein